MMVLDTNIIILYMNGEESIVEWINRHRSIGERFVISPISVVELLSFPRIKEEEIFRIEQWLQFVLLIDIDLSIAREAAQMRRECRLTTTDSIIAATAYLLHAPLITRDLKLKRVKQIQVEVP